MMTLKWNSGVHNFMTYATGDIPVGAMIQIASPTSVSVMVPSMEAAATPI
jgi:hypothetical protein